MAGRMRLALLAATVAALAAPVSASAALSSIPASSWQTNGRVRAIAVGAHKIFIGGDFTRCAAPARPSGGTARNHLAAFSLTTGKLMPWNPRANGTVTALRLNANATTSTSAAASPPSTATPAPISAAVTASGSTLRKWHANTNGTVYAIAVSTTRVYVGGSFDHGQGREPASPRRRGHQQHRSARALASERQLDRPRAHRVARRRQRVFAGGDFTAVNGKSHPHLAALLRRPAALSPFARAPAWPVTTLRTTGKQLVAAAAATAATSRSTRRRTAPAGGSR